MKTLQQKIIGSKSLKLTENDDLFIVEVSKDEVVKAWEFNSLVIAEEYFEIQCTVAEYEDENA